GCASGGESTNSLILPAVALHKTKRLKFSFILPKQRRMPANYRLGAPALRASQKRRPACDASGPPALNSNQRLVSPAPFVVQANAYDVIGQAAVERFGCGGRRDGERVVPLAAIRIRVLDPLAPHAAELPLAVC